MGKSVNPGLFRVSGFRALSAVLAWGVLFLSSGYDYALHDYGMQVLTTVLEMVVSFCNQPQYIVAAPGSWVRRGGALM